MTNETTTARLTVIDANDKCPMDGTLGIFEGSTSTWCVCCGRPRDLAARVASGELTSMQAARAHRARYA